jgi:hypothetical protein
MMEKWVVDAIDEAEGRSHVWTDLIEDYDNVNMGGELEL